MALVGYEWVEAPPLKGIALMLHGGGQTKHSWSGAATQLAASGWRTVAYDARGHGESEWATKGDYASDAFVADLTSVVADRSDGPPVLIGASLGGITSLLAIGEGHITARALVLVDLVPRVDYAGARRVREFMRRDAYTGFASLQDVAEAVRSYTPNRERAVNPQGLLKNLRRGPDGRWYWHWDPAFLPVESEAERLVDTARLRSAARRMPRVPTLLVRGRESDVVKPQGVTEFMKMVDHAEYVDVADAGHMVAGDENDAFSQAVTDFLSRLPSA